MFFTALIAILSMVSGFEWPIQVVESRLKGKYVVAKRDILPGELVHEEKEPLLYFSESSMVKCALPGLQETEVLSAAFSSFLKVPIVQKRKILDLFSPVDRPVTALYRAKASFATIMLPGISEPQPLPVEEMDSFIKICSAMRYNSFTNEGGYYLYDDLSRFSHSCTANCMYQIRGQVCSCYAAKPIKAGEEMTISYKGERDLDPTHERRAKYAAHKEFTCHCPRCDAIGDDTRQFDCVDPACKGVMMVHQPLSKEPVLADLYSYEGVAYVEPHLLPCTVCHRAAPGDYQKKMLVMEKRLPELATRLKAKQQQLLESKDYLKEHWQSLLHEAEQFKLPRRHLLTKPILDAKLNILTVLDIIGAGCVAEQRRRLALQGIQIVQNVVPYPRQAVIDAIRDVYVLQGCNSPKPVLSLKEEKMLLQKALRMHLIVSGREHRNELEDSALTKVLSQLPISQQQQQPQNMDNCAFCEESPLRAAMKRSRCGKCKQAVYCSVGCQKAHWPLHRKSCLPEPTNK